MVPISVNYTIRIGHTICQNWISYDQSYLGV